MSTIEVEVRGPLSQPQYDQLLSYLKVHGELVAQKERIFVDFTALIPGQSLPDRRHPRPPVLQLWWQERMG